VFDTETGLNQDTNREYNARTGRYIQSDPIALAGGLNSRTYAQGNPILVIDPTGLQTTVVINNNGIGHAGVVVGSGRSATLYDPGGSYRNAEKGSGDALYGRDVNLQDYINYQKRDGPDVQTYSVATTPEQEAEIRNRIENEGFNVPGSCAVDTSGALKGIGPFKNLGTSFTPGGLGRSLRRLGN
jgi:RHS repeat-associated protein